MSHNHVPTSQPGFGHFVNLTVTLLTVVIIGAGYFSAVGQFAGVA